jgi:hypothetical protein
MPSLAKAAQQGKPAVAPVADIQVSNHGSVFLFTPTGPEALETLLELVPPGPDHHYFGRSLVVEHRYARAVAEQLQEDGLSVA